MKSANVQRSIPGNTFRIRYNVGPDNKQKRLHGISCLGQKREGGLAFSIEKEGRKAMSPRVQLKSSFLQSHNVRVLHSDLH